MKLPKIFSTQNNTRTYHVKIKGTTGVLTFTELVKKSFVMNLFVKQLKKGGVEELEKEVDYNATYEVTSPSKLKFFQSFYKDYVDQVRKKLLKKNISIVNYDLRKILIVPYDEKSLKIDSELFIEVTS